MRSELHARFVSDPSLRRVKAGCRQDMPHHLGAATKVYPTILSDYKAELAAATLAAI